MRIAFISVCVLLLIAFYRFAVKGKIGRFRSSSLGNAVSQVHTLLRPSAQNIIEAKKTA